MKSKNSNKIKLLKNAAKKLCCGLLAAVMIITGFPQELYNEQESTVYAAGNEYKKYTVGNSTYTYVVYSDDTIGIRGYEGTDSRIEIPNEIEGKKVVEIGFWSTGEVFISGCDSIEEIVIPKNISNINIRLIGIFTEFAGCTNLKAIYVDEGNEKYKSIDGVLYKCDDANELSLLCYPQQKEDSVFVIPENVTFIYDDAFSNIHLKEIKVEEGNKNYKALDGVLLETFEGGNRTELKYYPPNRENEIYVVPQEVEIITFDAICYCQNLKKLVISEGVSGINWSISGCPNLTEIFIPKSFTYINGSLVSDCPSLKSINVEEGNPVYKSVDGVLFSADGTEIKRYPSDKDDEIYEIPEGVTCIGGAAFSDCTKLKKLIIPKSVTEVGRYNTEGIINCPNLIICGEKNSYAEKYAQKNNIPFNQTSDVILGDVNNDGEVDIKDSALIKRYLAGWDVEADMNMEAADVNGDGDVAIKDSALIKRQLAGWE